MRYIGPSKNMRLARLDWNMALGGQLGQKLVRPYLKNKLYMVVLACGPSYSGGGGRRISI
jgi:hypothetical protein